MMCIDKHNPKNFESNNDFAVTETESVDDDLSVEDDLIAWYVESEGNFTIRTRAATNVIYSKKEGNRIPLDAIDAFREVPDEQAENPGMEEGEILISKHGTDIEEKVVLDD